MSAANFEEDWNTERRQEKNSQRAAHLLLYKLLWQTRSRSQQQDHRVNGMESFWSFAKRRLVKFNGPQNTPFYMSLKETEFRFNHRLRDIYKTLLSCFRTHPL